MSLNGLGRYVLIGGFGDVLFSSVNEGVGVCGHNEGLEAVKSCAQVVENGQIIKGSFFGQIERRAYSIECVRNGGDSSYCNVAKDGIYEGGDVWELTKFGVLGLKGRVMFDGRVLYFNGIVSYCVERDYILYE